MFGMKIQAHHDRNLRSRKLEVARRRRQPVRRPLETVLDEMVQVQVQKVSVNQN